MLASIHTMKNDARGFTLIEISIALIIVGLIMVPAMRLYKTQTMAQRIKDTNENIKIVESALSKYVEKNGFYPAPSQPNIPMNNAGSGQAVDIVLNPPGACAVNSLTVCRTADVPVDIDSDGTPDFNDHALIGGVPFATLGIPYQVAIDGYGYQLKYAVTNRLTDEAQFENGGGAIRVQNDGRDPTRPLLYAAAATQGHYVVLSHGEDARGAFNQSGTVTAACGSAANGLDFENCNNDGIFRNNAFQYEDTPDTTPGPDGEPEGKVQFNRVPGAMYFDDYVAATNTTDSGLWAYKPNESKIDTTQDGNVELGVDPDCENASCVPRVRMNVNGAVLIEDQLKTQRLCDIDEADCVVDTAANLPYGWFTPFVIAGTPPTPSEADASWNATRQGNEGSGIRCIGDRGLRGISNFDEECWSSVRVSNPGIVGAGCNPAVDGRYPVGLDAAGQIICE